VDSPKPSIPSFLARAFPFLTGDDVLHLRLIHLGFLVYGRTIISGGKSPTNKRFSQNVTHSSCETSQNAQKTSRFISFLPLKSVPLIEVRLSGDEFDDPSSIPVRFFYLKGLIA
jgi:hypothetical protein